MRQRRWRWGRRELFNGLAAIAKVLGYTTPEINGMLLGALSASTGLKFADISKGFAAISKAELPNGRLAMIALNDMPFSN